jgi:hypothetical protein
MATPEQEQPDPAPQPQRLTPIEVPNPPEIQVDDTEPEVPKVGSRDAPGG